MGKFRQSPSPRDTVLAVVAAFAANDQVSLGRLQASFGKLTVENILDAIGSFGKMMAPAFSDSNVQNRVRGAVASELSEQQMTPEARETAQAITISLLTVAEPTSSMALMAKHADVMREQSAQVVMGSVMATSRVVSDLGVKLNFR